MVITVVLVGDDGGADGDNRCSADDDDSSADGSADSDHSCACW